MLNLSNHSNVMGKIFFFARDNYKNLHYLYEMKKRARPYNRDTALDAAGALFWKKGYHATSLKDLELALDMKPGSIYAAFSNKETLFSLTLERYFEKNRDAFRSQVLTSQSPLSGFATYLRAIARNNTDDPQCRACMLVKTLLNATAEDTAISARVRDYLEQMKTEMAAAFERAKQLGELPQNTDTTRLAQRYQSNVTTLKIEAHLGVDSHELITLAEGMAHEIEQLRPHTEHAPTTQQI